MKFEKNSNFDQLVDQLLNLSIAEDLGSMDITSGACLSGDITSNCILPEEEDCIADFIPREPGIMAGGEIVKQLYRKISPNLKLVQKVVDGEAFQAGDIIATIEGRARGILSGERIALNILQRMCGVATITSKFVKETEGTKAVVLDTRKTIPGWRVLDKLAVSLGGGVNHRQGLFDMILIKDNHIALAVRECNIASAAWAIRTSREQSDLPICVEIDSINQLEAVLVEEPDLLLLDNMTPEELHKIVEQTGRICSERKLRRPLLESSGGITLDKVRAIAKSGVDRLSVGALTHSVPALDIGLDIENNIE